MSVSARPSTARAPERIPRIGFLGVGWIGRQRMAAVADEGLVEAVAVADADAEARRQAAETVPGAAIVDGLDALLDADLDGVAIATPSALHAEQAVAVLERGVAVFCQKPLARDLPETRRVLEAARRADRLLGVDLSYRHTDAARAMRDVIAGGQLGTVHSAELVFHNAYGPDKSWFTRRRLSGGGCLIDLGTHLLDLVLWLTGSHDVTVASSRLRRRGEPVDATADAVEDFATADLQSTDTGIGIRLACSWFLPAGRDCVLECTLYGTDGAVTLRNLNGSFYDFVCERHAGTSSERLSEPGDDWGGRALAAWTRRLAAGERFDAAQARELETLAGALDRIYEVAR